MLTCWDGQSVIIITWVVMVLAINVILGGAIIVDVLGRWLLSSVRWWWSYEGAMVLRVYKKVY